MKNEEKEEEIDSDNDSTRPGCATWLMWVQC
jgi:hypothetical protein